MESLYNKMFTLLDGKHIVSICGAGGKTTLVNYLAKCSAGDGKRVCIMTTTRFKRPEDECMVVFEGFKPDKYEEAWQQGKVVVVGEKGYIFGMRPPVEEALDYINKRADIIYVEADGAKCKPLKYPSEWEPIILQGTDLIIIVSGLKALDQPFEEICHRSDIAKETLNITKETVDEELFAQILLAGYKKWNPVVLLNQADSEELQKRGENIAEILRKNGIDSVFVNSLLNT